MTRWLAWLVTVGLAAIVVYGVAAGSPRHTDPVRSITARLRCPVCQASSVADSPSATAQEMRSTVRQQVRRGRSEHQVLEYFRTRYGPWILLDPPASGTTLPLWLVPPLALVAGVAVIVRLRTRSGATESAAAAVGEPDDDERARAGAAAPASPELHGRWLALPRVPWVGPGKRTVAIGTVAALAVLAGSVATRRIVQDDSASASVSSSSSTGLDRISTAALERAVAQNPSVLPMRLALAQRHLRDGDVADAQRESELSLRQSTTLADRATALKYAGWSQALGGDPTGGASRLEQSLAIDPTDRDASWYLANVCLVGLQQPERASAILESLLQTGMTRHRRTVVLQRLADARAAIGATTSP